MRSSSFLFDRRLVQGSSSQGEERSGWRDPGQCAAQELELGICIMTVTANLHPTRFFFLNHGETDWDRSGRFAGRINAPLMVRGLAQARRAGEMLRSAGI